MHGPNFLRLPSSKLISFRLFSLQIFAKTQFKAGIRLSIGQVGSPKEAGLDCIPELISAIVYALEDDTMMDFHSFTLHKRVALPKPEKVSCFRDRNGYLELFPQDLHRIS